MSNKTVVCVWEIARLMFWRIIAFCSSWWSVWCWVGHFVGVTVFMQYYIQTKIKVLFGEIIQCFCLFGCISICSMSDLISLSSVDLQALSPFFHFICLHILLWIGRGFIISCCAVRVPLGTVQNACAVWEILLELRKLNTGPSLSVFAQSYYVVYSRAWCYSRGGKKK